MSKHSAFAVAGTAVLLCVLSSSGFHAGAQSPAFNGTTLAGWHMLGTASWRVEKGELVGSAGGEAGWLVLDRAYEDVGLRFSFRCVNCETGVLVRDVKAGDGTEGTYFSLAGSDAGTLYRVTLDPLGRETSRNSLGALQDRNNDPVQRTLNSNGWNEVGLYVRSEELTGTFNRDITRSFTAKLGDKARYGLVALRIGGGAGAEVRIKDISVDDLVLRPAIPPEVTDSKFRMRKLTDMFYSEGVAVGDINRDGIPDVVSGPFYYLGPDYAVAHEIYPAHIYNPNPPPYPNSMLNFVYDFNGDGWPDYLRVSLEDAWLYINPRGESRHWDAYRVSSLSGETVQLADIDGDGRPELITAIWPDRAHNLRGGQIGYAKPDWSDVTKPWTFHPVSEKAEWGNHAIGSGDVNGDGRMDILHGAGWFEQPPAGTPGSWKFHFVPFGLSPTVTHFRGAELSWYDVNGDGLPDVVGSLYAHGAGLVWWEHKRDAQGVDSWKLHTIMGDPLSTQDERKNWEETDKSMAFTGLHSVVMADMDGDGLQDIVTGKRWLSHGDRLTSADALDPLALAWFKTVRKPGGQVEFEPHMISNQADIGVQIALADVNGDGKMDIVVAGRKGVFIFFNQR